MRAAFALAVFTLLLGCEPAQKPTPKTEPSSDRGGNAAQTDHVWRAQVQALDKARAAADAAGRPPADPPEAP